MFRKPKSKNIRQRVTTANDVDDDPAEENVVGENVPSVSSTTNSAEEDDCGGPAATVPDGSKSQTLLSFADDEGDRTEVKLKKTKKSTQERRLRQLEATHRMPQFEDKTTSHDIKVLPLRTDAEPVLHSGANTASTTINSGEKYKVKRENQDNECELLEDDDEDTTTASVREKFGAAYRGIPDARAIFEARKRREQMRRQGPDIPLDDTQRLRAKGERQRLVREDDENDDSDEERRDEKFYSARSLLRNADELRREEQLDMLAAQETLDDDAETERHDWEQQQISKAVGVHAMREMQITDEELRRRNQLAEIQRRREQNALARKNHDLPTKRGDSNVDMDVDIGAELDGTPVDTLADVHTIDFALSQIAVKLADHVDVRNTREHEQTRLRDRIQENVAFIVKMETTVPQLTDKHAMLQELRVFVAHLLDMFDEKHQELKELEAKKRETLRQRQERLSKRMRQDVRDEYDACCAATAGNAAQQEYQRKADAQTRAIEREARRGRRRRAREAAIEEESQKPEGLSTDDEETPSQTDALQNSLAEISAHGSTLFADVDEEFSSVRRVARRMLFWLQVDERSFSNAHVALCMPKLLSLFIRHEFLEVNVLKDYAFRLEDMRWYIDLLGVYCGEPGVDVEHPHIVSLIPLALEKVVLPIVAGVVEEEWSPLSESETRRLTSLLRQIRDECPQLGQSSRQLQRFLASVKKRYETAIEDLFMPMFSKQSLENPITGCKAFLNRRFWTGIKLIRSAWMWRGLLSDDALYEICVAGVLSRSSALALQMLSTDDGDGQQMPARVRAVLDYLQPEMCRPPAIRAIHNALKRLYDPIKAQNKDVGRDLKKLLDRLDSLSQ